MTPKFVEQPTTNEESNILGGLPVRTDLRAGLAWDELDDKAVEWWNQLSSAVSNAVSNVTSSSTDAA
jgi:hypothetical protein